MLADVYIAGFGDAPFVVYQLLDYHGTPLYIGQTSNLLRRLLEHSKDKEWFGQVKSVWYEPAYGRGRYRDDVYALERQRINQFNPRYNRPTRVSSFPQPMATCGALLPVEQVDALRQLAELRRVKLATIVREIVGLWFDNHADEIADVLSAPAEDARVAV